MRLDQALVERGLALSRVRAQGLIRAGFVTVNGLKADKNAALVDEADAIRVTGETLPYVSRGALKLIAALDRFQVDPKGLTCMDIGASTGGFTEVLLERGADRVYAIDAGTDQLAGKLRADPRVTVMEQTNARALTPDMFAAPIALAVMDVSFISIKLILPAAFTILGDGGRMIALVKPQFEAGPKALNKHGVVTDPREHERVLDEIAAFVQGLGWRVEDVIPSPIQGGSGNREFLALMTPDGSQACPDLGHGPVARQK